MRLEARTASLVAVMAVVVGSATTAVADEQHSFSGTVYGDAGKPLDGAVVTVKAGTGDFERTGISDKSGRWTVSVPDGVYYIGFADEGRGYLAEQFDNHLETRSSSHSKTMVLSDGDISSVDAQLTRVGTISGRVMKDGQPAAGGDVRFEPQIGGDYVNAAVDDDGRFIVKDVIPGLYSATVALSRPGSQEYSRKVAVTVGSGQEVRMPDIIFPDASTSGTLQVRATSTVPRQAANFWVWSASNPVEPIRDGLGVGHPFDDLAPGRYKISTGLNDWVGGHSFFDAKNFTVKAGETTTADAVVGPQTMLMGFVRNTRRQDLLGITLLLRRADDPSTVVAPQ
ncbi:MSCRAMM family protein [Aeromicrobium chenweiae]|uniref:MSCRAMM family protein n=1 Tax=Aeromicrobium chenweiae TaxID=2079793 RepID=UPI00131EE00F|nr:carboxypeptidase regulatory-like domain-containing protein [Aeromicrobium chenweiae]